MKSQKGITLISLAIYIMVTLIVIGILTIITANLRNNIKEINNGGANSSEFDRFNIYFLKEVKKEDNDVNEITTSNEISFTSGNKYTFKDYCIYLNDNIKLAENIERCVFSTDLVNSKKIIKVIIKIVDGEERTIEYTLLANKSKGTYETTEKNKDGTLTANATYKSDGYTAVIPKGFKISDVVEEQKIDDGLVIEDSDGNEFVWIPVVVPEGQQFTDIFYRSEWSNNARTTGLNANYTEPYASGYTGEKDDYEAMKNSVEQNKGFYIGRYEAGSTELTDKTKPKARTNTANGTSRSSSKKRSISIYLCWMGEYE